MREQVYGWILNLSSAAARMPSGPPFGAAVTVAQGTMYGGTKSFLDRWSVSLAAEMHGHGVAVNCLSPEAAGS